MLFYNELLFYTCGCWGSAGQRSWVVVVDIVKMENNTTLDNLAQIDDIVDIDLMYISSISSIYQK